jgi:membrane-associated HD superfamily phosphohydrolase
LYNYLTDKQNFIKNENILSKKSSIVQVGKYFDKWSSLSKEQKLERFESFSIYYIDKHLIETRLLDTSFRDTFINTLYNLLKDAFESKQLLYKNISWNIKRGVIDYVKILQYDNKIFKLNVEKLSSNKVTTDKVTTGKVTTDKVTTDKVTTDNVTMDKVITDKVITDNVTMDKVITDNVTMDKEVKINTKKVSTKQIITKDTEKIINEDLLHFILKRIQNGVNEISEQDFQNFLERIKIKLKVKKLSAKDISYISDKYKEIFEVVNNNI